MNVKNLVSVSINANRHSRKIIMANLKKTIVAFMIVFAGLVLTGCAVQPPSELVKALDSENLDEFESMLEENPKLINSKYAPEGETLLHWGVQSGKKELVELLVANGADVNAKNSHGSTALNMIGGIRACRTQNHRDIAKFLIANGARTKTCKNFLHRVLILGWYDLAKLAVDEGVDVNEKNPDGYTPLHFANNIEDNKEFTKLLIDNGAEVNAKSKRGATPLHVAASTRNGRTDIAELLVANGAEVNAKNTMGRTPLHETAAWSTDIGLIELLIDKGADVNTKDNEGITPLHSAVATGRKDIVELLIIKGAEVNAKNRWGRTPLTWAVKGPNEEIVELLREHGAKE
jgi:ankyrin repeat protein